MEESYSKLKIHRIIRILAFTGLFLTVILTGCSTTAENETDPLNRILNALGFVQNSDAQNSSEVKNEQPAKSENTENNVLGNLKTTEEVLITDTPEPTPTVYNIQLWVPPQFDTEQDTKAGKALSSAIAKYTEGHPNVNISLRVKASSGDSSMLNTLSAAGHVAKDVLPSLALISRGEMETAVQRGLILPITTSIFSESNTWINFARQAAVIDSTVYGIPILGDGLVLIYRPSKTGTELGDWQDILTRGLPIGFSPSSSTSLFGAFIYLSLGGKITNEQGQAYLDQQKLTETLNFFLTGGQNGAFPPSLAQLIDQAQIWQRFSEGTMSLIISQFSSFRHYQSPEIAIRTLPLSESVAEYPLINTWNLVLVEDNPALQEESIKFAEYLSSTEINDTLSVNSGYLPVRSGTHEAWINDPQYDVIKTMSDNAALVPNNQIINKIVPIINNAISQVIKNQLSPEDAAKEAISSLN